MDRLLIMEDQTYTVIQRTTRDVWEHKAATSDLMEALQLASDLCNANGVARTIVLDRMGYTVGIES